MDNQLHFGSLSTRNTTQILGELGVDCSHVAVHNSVQKADLQPASDADPKQVLVNETVVPGNDERHWLSAAVDRETNELLYIHLFQTRMTQLSCCFSVNSARNSGSSTPPSSSMRRTTSSLRSSTYASDLRCVATKTGTAANMSFMRRSVDPQQS